MNATRQQLHSLVDLVEEIELNTLYNVMIRFIPEDDAFPDEAASHTVAMEQYKSGEVLREEEIDWS